MSLESGKKAPDFDLQDKDGTSYTLDSFAGKKLIIFFYPKDNTPGCTKEACKFRDLKADFDSADTVIVGVSKDGAKSHAKFIEKFDLPYVLLSDEDTEMMQAYDCWKEKSLYGKKYMGTVRSSVLIDESGNILHHWEKVKKAETHPEEVLEVLKSL